LTVNARGNYEGAFALVTGDVATNNISTKFLRPEDGAWDKKNHNRYFFVTTDQMDAAKDGFANKDITANQVGRSRLWSLTFLDSSKPELGGNIEMLLDGTSAKGDYQMFDNITVNEDGTLIMLEDVGNNQHNGKVWKFSPANGSLVKLAGFDPLLFGDINVTGSITKDEETSGVIDVTEILDREDDNTYNLFVAQNHALSGDPETVEGGQLLLMTQPAPKHDDGDGHDDGDHK
jgi:secreted PhoX family phosphatase